MLETALDYNAVVPHINAIQEDVMQAAQIINEIHAKEQEAQGKSTRLNWLEQILSSTQQTAMTCQMIVPTLEELSDALRGFQNQLQEFAEASANIN